MLYPLSYGGTAFILDTNLTVLGFHAAPRSARM